MIVITYGSTVFVQLTLTYLNERVGLHGFAVQVWEDRPRPVLQASQTHLSFLHMGREKNDFVHLWNYLCEKEYVLEEEVERYTYTPDTLKVFWWLKKCTVIWQEINVPWWWIRRPLQQRWGWGRQHRGPVASAPNSGREGWRSGSWRAPSHPAWWCEPEDRIKGRKITGR